MRIAELMNGVGFKVTIFKTKNVYMRNGRIVVTPLYLEVMNEDIEILRSLKHLSVVSDSALF